jgi:hypothetical protein
MTPDDVLESFGRIFDVFNHGKLNISISDNVCIGLIFLFTFRRALLMFEARFVKVDFFRHDDGLNGDKNLEESGDFSIPVFHGTASPSTEKRQTNFTTGVQVGIEPDLSITSGGQVDFGRIVGVSVIKVDIEQVSAMSIRRAVRSHDEGLHEVNPFFIASDINGVSVFNRQCMGDVGQFLGQSDCFRWRGFVVGNKVRVVMMLCDLSVLVLHVDVVES